ARFARGRQVDQAQQGPCESAGERRDFAGDHGPRPQGQRGRARQDRGGRRPRRRIASGSPLGTSMAQSNAATAVQNLFKTPELKDKILFTLLCLLVYRIGAAVTAPGINPQAIADYLDAQKNGGGLLGLYNLFTGGQLARATVFALGIMPYISASIFQQIAQAVVPQFDKMSKDEEGRKKINQWSRYATVVLAAIQAWGF